MGILGSTEIGKLHFLFAIERSSSNELIIKFFFVLVKLLPVLLICIIKSFLQVEVGSISIVFKVMAIGDIGNRHFFGFFSQQFSIKLFHNCWRILELLSISDGLESTVERTVGDKIFRGWMSFCVCSIFLGSWYWTIIKIFRLLSLVFLLLFEPHYVVICSFVRESISTVYFWWRIYFLGLSIWYSLMKFFIGLLLF